MRKLFFASSLFIFSAISPNVFAQFSATIGPGVTSYSGDVSGVEVQNARPALNVELWYQFNRNLYIKSGAGVYQISANDVFENRNRAFQATNFEVYSTLMLGGDPSWRLMPFGYAGLGITTISPQYAINNDQGEFFLDAKELQTEGRDIPGAALTFPMGLGFRFRLNDKLALVADAGIRFANTDLLDGVSTRSIEVASLSQEAVNYFEAIRPEGINGAETLSNGNPDSNDVYGIFSLKLLFRLNGNKNGSGRGNSMPCPPFYRQ